MRFRSSRRASSAAALIAASTLALATLPLITAPANAAATPSTIYVSACNASTSSATVTSGSVAGSPVTSIDWTSATDSLTVVNNCSTNGTSMRIGVSSLDANGTGASIAPVDGTSGSLLLGSGVSQILVREVTSLGPPTIYGATLATIAATSPAPPSIVANSDGSATVTFTNPMAVLYLCPTSVSVFACSMGSATYSVTMTGKTSPFTLRAGDAATLPPMNTTPTTIAAGTYNMNLGSGTTASNVLLGTPAPTPTGEKPGTPGKPTAVAGTGKATVSVVAPTSGGTPTSYTVTSSPDAKTCTVTVPATSCEVSGLTNGTTYTFTSTATNAEGTSAASAASDPVTPDRASNDPAVAPKFAKAGKIAQPGTSVILRKGVITPSGVMAKARVQFTPLVKSAVVSGDVRALGSYTVAKNGRVTVTVNTKDPISIRLVLTAPGTDEFKPYKKVKTWALS